MREHVWIVYDALLLVYMYDIYMDLCVYSKASLTDHLHRPTTPLYRSLYVGPKLSSMQIFELLKSITSLNRPPKVGPPVGLFREV